MKRGFLLSARKTIKGTISQHAAGNSFPSPEGATPAEVPISVVHDLAIVCVPAVVLLWSLMIICVSMYQVDRTKHEENLQTLGRG